MRPAAPAIAIRVIRSPVYIGLATEYTEENRNPSDLAEAVLQERTACTIHAPAATGIHAFRGT
jgi:hypothetical protein